jgi:hypothetical protein
MTDVLDRLEVLDPFTSPLQPQPTNRRERFDPSPAALWIAASLSIAAGIIHLVMVPSHAGESLAEGVGFALAGWFQLVAAWLFLSRRVRTYLAPIAVANVLFIGAWVWSRTAGIPFGAHAGQAESVGFVDLTTVALETALLLWCALLVHRPRLGRDWARGARNIAVLAVVAIFGLTTAAIASPSARDHAAHSHDTPVDDKGLAALSNGHHHAIGAEQPLDAATRAELTHQISITQEVAKQYPTVAAAEAAGYRRAGPYSPGLGVHYIRPSGAGLNTEGVMTDAALREPLSIIYAGTNPDSPIAGFMYYAMSPNTPQGFAGPNDVWHYHTNVCLKYGANGIDAPFGADSDVPADLCTRAGGQVLQQTQWMVHVWSVPGWESQQGLFGEVNPALACPDGTYYQLPQDQWPSHPLNVCRGT